MVSVDLQIPARSPYVGVVRLALSSLARTAGLDEEALDDLKIAVSEACANAVLASEEAGSEDPIVIRWTEEADRLTVDISDPATSHDDQSAVATDTGGFSTRLAMSGALLETLVDSCEIEPLPEGGIRTRLVVTRPTS
jgi:anti-sigma regulatory factor (Ser/Thr protein kinase)